MIEDETIVHEPADGMIVSAATFKSGKSRVQMNAFHDMIPAIRRTSACWTIISCWRWPSAALTRRRMI
ncbi:MAG TPA: hypothetical protein VKB85_04750 [Propionibacteriaceae bacterium]|nr:hypothetical protein [Propionibacteriaceae bacterium]